MPGENASGQNSTSFVLGLIGAALLIGGVFAPVLHIPIVGDLDYFRNGKGDGVIVLVLGALSGFLVLIQTFKLLWLTALGAGAVCVYSLADFLNRLGSARTGLDRDLAGNPFRGLASVIADTISLQWGWALLFAGVLFLLAAAAKSPSRAVPIARTSDGSSAAAETQTRQAPPMRVEPGPPTADIEAHAARKPATQSEAVSASSEASPLFASHEDRDAKHVSKSDTRKNRPEAFLALVLLLGAVTGVLALSDSDTTARRVRSWFGASQTAAPHDVSIVVAGPSRASGTQERSSVIGTEAVDVRAIQIELKRLGYDPGQADGIAGPKTRQAVRQFQSDRKQSVDGELTSSLLRQLALSSAPLVARAKQWSLVGKQGTVGSGVNFVVIERDKESDQFTYDDAIAELCKPGTWCTVKFWSDRSLAASRLPMSVAQCNAMTADYL